MVLFQFKTFCSLETFPNYLPPCCGSAATSPAYAAKIMHTSANNTVNFILSEWISRFFLLLLQPTQLNSSNLIEGLDCTSIRKLRTISVTVLLFVEIFGTCHKLTEIFTRKVNIKNIYYHLENIWTKKAVFGSTVKKCN